MKSNDDEIVVREGRRNHRSIHLDPFDWAGGRALLTNRRLIFRPNFLNFRTAEESIRLEGIVSIEAKHSGFISNKFPILLRNGSVVEFRVSKRKDWVKAIEQAVKEKKKEHGEGQDISTTIDFRIPKKSPRWYIKVAIQALLLALCVGVVALIFQRFLY
ncbi:MAG: hypothetical protein JRJ77_08310 [Deltaproteobacteria bacterium]|nr:hypothetical protein [Deltaproteobacteria bacterium]MBW2340976.1 hypothetical protein [Deltaproteobacteria bacterium]